MVFETPMTVKPIAVRVPQWKSVAETIRTTAKPGDVIYHTAIATMLGIAYGTQKYSTNYTTIKSYLEKRGFITRTERKVGMVVLQPEEHVDEAMRRRGKSRNATKAALSVLYHTDVSGLTQDELNRHGAGQRVLEAELTLTNKLLPAAKAITDRNTTVTKSQIRQLLSITKDIDKLPLSTKGS